MHNEPIEMVLRHAIGKSTLQEGISVPRALEEWIGSPPAGSKRTIFLCFEGCRVPVTLRRLGNTRGHVQIKYENSSGSPFRNWLSTVFHATLNGGTGEFLELRRITNDDYAPIAFPLLQSSVKRLHISDWLYHQSGPSILENHPIVREIPAVIRSVLVSDGQDQAHYNQLLSTQFIQWQWESEKRVIPQLPLKCDFAKDSVRVEVEFGNARTYYQDFIKFMLAYHQKIADVGVLLVPTEGFAKQLCQVGRSRALEKGKHSYSGMIHFAKVHRELDFLRFMLSMPIVIGGIGPEA
jgi:hypothetical protein